MKAKIADAIAEFVRQADSDLEARFESQVEELLEARCTHPVIGKWVDNNDVETMLAALDLDDQDFAQRFPALSHLTLHQRQRCVAAIETHADHCIHCSLKRGYDLDLDMRIERAFSQNKSELLHLLQEDRSETSEGDEDHKVKALSAHH